MCGKHASVHPRLEGEIPKTISFGRNVQGAKSLHVWGETSRGRNVHLYGANRLGANHPGVETSRANHPGAKRAYTIL